MNFGTDEHSKTFSSPLLDGKIFLQIFQGRECKAGRLT
jgi:hypothetical protein